MKSTNSAQSKQYWRCIDRTCNGTMKTNFNIERGVITYGGQPHLHEADYAAIQAQEVVRAIKRRAESHPNEPPSVIYRDEIANVHDEEVQSKMPERNNIIRNINRRQNRRRPLNPQSLVDLQISPPYTHTLNGSRFLQHDSGVDDPERFLVFFTDRSLERLCISRIMICDGTFKVVPNEFYQLYTIHGAFMDHVFTLIYCLTTTKNQIFYNNLLNLLKIRAQERNMPLEPQYINSDFELAFMSAASNVFPNSVIHGCNFHFGQAIWKRTVNIGLKVPYGNNQTVKYTISYLRALPFVPVNDVVETFEMIVEQANDDNFGDELRDLLNYVNRVYIQGVTARGRRRAKYILL